MSSLALLALVFSFLGNEAFSREIVIENIRTTSVEKIRRACEMQRDGLLGKLSATKRVDCYGLLLHDVLGFEKGSKVSVRLDVVFLPGKETESEAKRLGELIEAVVRRNQPPSMQVRLSPLFYSEARSGRVQGKMRLQVVETHGGDSFSYTRRFGE
jgi:hypothetical protein